MFVLASIGLWGPPALLTRATRTRQAICLGTTSFGPVDACSAWRSVSFRGVVWPKPGASAAARAQFAIHVNLLQVRHSRRGQAATLTGTLAVRDIRPAKARLQERRPPTDDGQQTAM